MRVACMCIYTDIFAYIHMHTQVNLHTYIGTYVETSAHTVMYVLCLHVFILYEYMQRCIYILVCMYKHTHVEMSVLTLHVYLHMYLHMYLHVKCIYTRIYTCVYVCKYMCTYTCKVKNPCLVYIHVNGYQF